MNVAAPQAQAVPLGDPSRSFDVLFSEGNLLQLLVAIRGSAMPEEEKIMLRDLVLEYSQLTEENEKEIVRKQVMQGIAGHEKDFSFLATDTPSAEATPVSTPDTTAPPPPVEATAISQQKNLGRQRPRPAFTTQAATPTQPVEVSEVVPTPEPAIKAESVSTAPAPEAEPIPAPSESQPTTNAMPRIQEIKQAVNSRIGNPVNLIDADNTVGREYMTALLAAMKKASGGSQPGELQSAMDRLEAAFSNVEQLIDSKGITLETIEAAKAEESAKAESQPVVPEPPVNQAPESVPDTSEQTPVEKKLQVKSVSVPETSAQEPTPTSESIDSAPTAPTVETPTVKPLTSMSDQLSSLHKTSTPEQAAPPVEMEPKAEEVKIPKEEQDIHEIKAVTEVETLPEKMDTLKKVLDKKAAEDRASLGQDLYDDQVTSGLQQLLSEWKLFKSSGLLGTGPSGADHPLYQQLKELPMAAVVSGRFEGATPEVKQSITDYMNGWRYEQHVVHEMTEVFDHYLRRVILSILKSQQNTETEEEK